MSPDRSNPTPPGGHVDASHYRSALGRRAGALALLGVGALIGATLLPGAEASGHTVASCPAGSLIDRKNASAVRGSTDPDKASGSGVDCKAILGAEGTELLDTAHSAAARTNAPFATVADGAYASAVAQRDAIAAGATSSVSTAPWQPLGIGPEQANVAGYNQVNGLGLAGLSGRIQSFERDASDPTHWWVGVANGGVWETHNSGGSWNDISLPLPTQIVGAIAHTSYAGGRLLASTGDPAFGGDSFSGLGAFYTANDGATWQRAAGVPSGTISFRLAVDPADPSIVYDATGKGLYRSVDGGATYTNVVLPTTCTTLSDPNCFFANIVTDVVVRTPAADGSGAHQVLAAVGWRAGQKLNAAGKPQAPQNGLYSSATGAPGTFTYLPATGFPATAEVGRVALGAATGPAQNHGFVYAVVQDATKFNGSAIGEVDVTNPAGAPTNTYLQGVYVSGDFGRTWALLTGPTQLGTTSGTALAGANTATYAPGIQSWYNEWIAVDPTVATAAGSPTRVTLGLEEIFENQIPLTDQQTLSHDTTPFKAIGAYFKGTSCGGLNTNLPACPTVYNSPASSTTTHPDQHAAMFVPDTAAGGSGSGVTLVVGNDGGAYAQHVAAGYALPAPAGSDFDNARWGNGINNGLHTLLPYVAKMAKDGTVYGGLQDNGNLKITPSGNQIETYGGDGFFSAVDPNNSNTTYEEYTYGAIATSTDGGQTWRAMPPPGASATTALFAAPFSMDPKNANHILAGNNQIVETLQGPNTDASNTSGVTTEDWNVVFNLGTSPTAAGGTTNNIPSATDLRGDNAYVGFCGYCDIVTGGLPFHSGLATNVGGATPPKAGTPSGWHIAPATGLPQRYITGVRIDPADPKTVFVTLGGYGRRWIPPGSLSDPTANVGSGHLFVSHDAGNTFTDISGNLPDVPANTVTLQKGRLLVGTDLGTFIAPTLAGKKFTVLGKGLPTAPVLDLEISPRNINEVVAASYGRGVYHLILPTTTVTGPTATTASVTGAPPASQPSTPTRQPSAVPAQDTGLSPQVHRVVLDGLQGLAALCLLGAGVTVARRRRIAPAAVTA